MKNRRTAYIVLFVLLVPVMISAQKHTEERIHKVENSLTPEVRIQGERPWTLEERMAFHKVPGISVAVIQDFKIDWVKGYGVRDINTNEPVNQSSLFQAASITKPVTAVLALYLTEAGILELDKNVNDYLISWKIPENEFTKDEKVTLRRLLSHSAGLTVSGFRGYGKGEAVPDIYQVLDGESPSNSDSIRVDYVPGSQYRYSGGGYTVLQLMIEDVMKIRLPDLADEIIFKPVGMRNSSLHKPLPKDLASQITSAHTREGEARQPHWFLKGGSACCGLWTTAEDLAKFAIDIQRSIRGDKDAVISPDMARAIMEPTNSDHMGLGFALDHRDKSVYFVHGGGNPPGFTCYLIAHKDAGYGAVVMTNSTYGAALYREIIRAIANTYGWQDYQTETYESVAELTDTLRKIQKENTLDPRINEGRLNRLGYDFLRSKNFEGAVSVFQLNTELYFKSANTYDSLGDAYRDAGQIEKAIESYQKAIETLDQYPESNQRSTTLRDTSTRKIEELAESLKQQK